MKKSVNLRIETERNSIINTLEVIAIEPLREESISDLVKNSKLSTPAQ